MNQESIIEIIVAGRSVQFEVLPSRGRRLGLRYHTSDGMFQLKIPGGKWTTDAQKFVKHNESWILKHLPLIEADKQLQRAWWEAAKTGTLRLRGQEYEFRVASARKAVMAFEGQQVTLKGPAGADIRELMFLGLYQYARDTLPGLVATYAAQTEIAVKRVTVKRNLRSKWGSASSLGNMNLNWLIILLPEEYIRYLIIHELMHFREMNHSPRFWAWVEKYEPNYQYLDKSLKEWGWVFGLFGK